MQIMLLSRFTKEQLRTNNSTVGAVGNIYLVTAGPAECMIGKIKVESDT